MKINRLLTLVYLVLAGIIQGFAQTGLQYEYVVSGKTEQGSVSGTMLMQMMNGNSRMEMRMSVPGAPPMLMVMLTLQQKPGVSYELIDASKAYVEHVTSTTPSQYEVMQVGAAEKVGSFNATKVKLKIDGEEQWMWVSKDVPGYGSFASVHNQEWDVQALFNALKAKGVEGFPVKMEQAQQGVSFTMQMVKAEQKPLDAKLFQLPADYKKQASTTPMQGMPQVDMDKLMKMSEEERARYLEELKKQYGVKDEDE